MNTNRAEWVGRTIDGKHQILAKIGQGGMGEVYRARHIMMDREEALKLLRIHLTADEDALKRFQQEAKAASRIEHPNAVTIYDFGQAEEGLYYIAMELVDGVNLKQVLRDGGPMAIERAVVIIRQICAVLAEAHRMGVVHRDIKPENIMLARKGDRVDFVKVLDFGIAKLLKDESSAGLTQTGMVFGTPKYMSPEQIQGKVLDGRADIYALGCVIYEMLTGRPPFEGEADLDLMLKHLHQEPPPMLNVAPPDRGVTAEIEHVILKALSKDSTQRFTADEFARELERAVTVKMERPVPAADLTPVTPASPPPPPPPTWTAKTVLTEAAPSVTPPPPPPQVLTAPVTPAPPAVAAPRSSTPVVAIAGALLVLLGVGLVLLYLKPWEKSTGTVTQSSQPQTSGQQGTLQSGTTTAATSTGASSTTTSTTPNTTIETNGGTGATRQEPGSGQPGGSSTTLPGGTSESDTAKAPALPRFQKLSNDAVRQAGAGNISQAQMLLAEAVQLEPASPELHFNLAQIFILQKRYKDAAEELRLYLQYRPGAEDRTAVEALIERLDER